MLQSLSIPFTGREYVTGSEGNRSSTPKPSQETGLKVFNFEIVGVNAKGEQIKKESKQSQYFAQDLGNGITLEMVAIPGGTFTMGTEDEEIERLVKKFNWEGYRKERPQHKVTVPPFFMGKYPITQAQWKAIASLTDLKVEKDLDLNPAHFKDPPKPPLKRGASDSPPFEGGARGRAVSFKLSIADFESINLIEDSQVYLFLIKRVSHNN